MVAPAARPTPGRRGLWIAVALMVAGVILGIVLIVRGALSIGGTVEGYQRVPADRGGTVRLEGDGRHLVFHEYPGASRDRAGPDLTVTITAPDGSSVPVGRVLFAEAYHLDGRDGALIARFDAPSPGEYRISADTIGELAIGRSGPFGSIATIVGGVLGGGLLFLAGVVLLIVSLVRRSSARRPVQPNT